MAGEVVAGSPPAATRASHGRSTTWLRIAWLLPILVVAAALRAAPWFNSHVFTGVMEYDDGVYYAAARAVLHGLVPYRDFTVVHPPLTSILLAPAAAIGVLFGDPAGMAAARIEVLAADCVNVWLVFRLTSRAVRGWHDTARRLAPLAAAALYAVAPGAVAAAHTVLLEPFTNLLVLLAMSVLLRSPLTNRAAAGGGALLAAADGVKIFAAVYVVVVAGWLLFAARDRLLPLLAGFGGTMAVIFGPFALLAGVPTLWRDLVMTQLTRPSDGGASSVARATDLFGVGAVPAAVGLAVAAVWLCGGTWSVVRIQRQQRNFPPQLWVWSAILVLTAVAFERSPSFFTHYAAFFAAPLAVLVGATVAAALTPATKNVVRSATVATAATLLIVATAGSVRDDRSWQASPSLAAAARLIPAHACVYSDAVSLAIAADRFRLPDRTCPGWLDGRGQNLVWSVGKHHGEDFYPHGFLADARWQAETLRQLEAASYLLVRSDPRRMPEWGPAAQAYAASHFREAWAGRGRIDAELWVRIS